MSKRTFSDRVLAWYDRCGRKDLPWQREATPYRVWVSEIMLQQTRVTTVIPYFERFTARFPNVAALAAAPLDEVFALWSGLGYYARARNLHAAAKLICDRHGGVFPRDLETLTELPGIGRSSAGAILALVSGRRHAILDGNVKRLLARHCGIEGWPGRSAVGTRLWQAAEARVPVRRVAAYTQATMDLGALVCTRAHPRCGDCPLAEDCVARRTGRQQVLPEPRPVRQKPVRQILMILACLPSGEVLLERRPPVGVWGGLWSLPEARDESDCRRWLQEHLDSVACTFQYWPSFRHSFSHFHLDITPVRVELNAVPDRVMEDGRLVWYKPFNTSYALAAPVQRLINALPPSEGVSHGSNRPLRQTG